MLVLPLSTIGFEFPCDCAIVFRIHAWARHRLRLAVSTTSRVSLSSEEIAFSGLRMLIRLLAESIAHLRPQSKLFGRTCMFLLQDMLGAGHACSTAEPSQR